ncbi:MAG: diguanylate cyclase [Actinomycetota bacterium]|nr:diguanylate cyclase [Actinomycetota bacterium]
MKVLVVDDDVVCRLALKAMVNSLGHECVAAANGREAWHALEGGGIDVLISDRQMPDMDGLQLCRLLRARTEETYVYVIMATVLDDMPNVEEGMLAGADDYLQKPLTLETVRLRMIAAERVSAMHRRFEALNMELRMVARKNPLTGLGNRLSLQEDLEAFSIRAIRYGHRYCVAMYDLDSFADFNRRYGKEAGDRALLDVVMALANNSRGSSDPCYLWGGDRIVCVYSEQSADNAVIAVERTRGAIAAMAIPHEGSRFDGVLTVSVGIAEMTREYPAPGDVMRQADSALFYAKSIGRNTVEIAHKPTKLLERST